MSRFKKIQQKLDYAKSFWDKVYSEEDDAWIGDITFQESELYSAVESLREAIEMLSKELQEIKEKD